MAFPNPDFSSFAYSWASIKLRVAELEIDARGISYNTTIDRTDVRGRAINIRSRTRGDATHAGELMLLKEDFDTLKSELAARAPEGFGFMNVPFGVVVMFERTPGGPLQTDTLENCLLNEVGHDYSQSTDALEVTLPLNIGRILYNGLDAV